MCQCETTRIKIVAKSKKLILISQNSLKNVVIKYGYNMIAQNSNVPVKINDLFHNLFA